VKAPNLASYFPVGGWYNIGAMLTLQQIGLPRGAIES